MIAAIIVLYHPDLAVLERLLGSVVGQVDRVIAVDNTPCPSSNAAELVERFSGTYTPLGQNHGIAQAQNIGIQASIDQGCSHVLLLDQDSTLPATMVKALLDAEAALLSRGENVGAICPQVVDEKTGRRPSAVYYRWFRARKRYVDAESREPIETDNLIASGCIIRIAVLRSVGMMRSELFIEYVDTEWVLRAHTAGYKSYCVPNAVMMHCFGDAAASLCGKDIYVYSALRYYYKLRNAVYLARVRSMGWHWRAYILSRIPFHFVVYSWFSERPSRTARVLLRAVLDGLYGRLGPATYP